MGAAAIVEGGQTMNPSVQDILTAISSVGYQELVLLPNNGNILLAARQAAEQTPRTVRIVPTRSLPQGIAALLAFNYGEDLDTNVRLMEEAAGRVASIEVTAGRADHRGGRACTFEQGQALGLLDDTIVAVCRHPPEAALGALAQTEPDAARDRHYLLGSGRQPRPGRRAQRGDRRRAPAPRNRDRRGRPAALPVHHLRGVALAVPRIGVVTDSTADFPGDAQERLGIEMVPLSVIWDRDSFRDKIDLTIADFYAADARAHDAARRPPRRPPALFEETYERLLGEADHVISVHLAGKLSATYDVARSAAERVGKGRVSVVDSGQTTMCLGWLAMRAAELGS